MTASGRNGSHNLACLIRWKCAGLKGEERQRKGQELLAAVPETARPAVVAALKARAGR